jgi:hypothetical protein
MLEVNVVIDAKSIAYLKKISDMPRQVPGAIQRGLNTGLETIKERLITKRLSGQGPFPPSQHRLGEVTGLLKATVYSRSIIQGNKVIGYIGAEAPYAGVHEYGAVIKAKNAPFLVFKVRGKTIRTKEVTIPARAPFSTEVDSAASTKIIADAVFNEVSELGSE